MAKYIYKDSANVPHELTVFDIDGKPSGLTMSANSARALGDDLNFLGKIGAPTSPLLMVTIELERVKADDGSTPAADATPPAKVPFEALAHDDIPVGTTVTWTNSAHRYVRRFNFGETPCGNVTKCAPGFIDWYVEVTPI